MTEPVPPCGSQFRVAPLRHDKVVPQQHSIERPGSSHEFFASLRVNDFLDHRVDGRIFYAHDIVRPDLIRRSRAPIRTLLVAGKKGLPPPECNDVEVPSAEPVLVLRLIDSAHRYSNANFLERRLVEQIDALK